MRVAVLAVVMMMLMTIVIVVMVIVIMRAHVRMRVRQRAMLMPITAQAPIGELHRARVAWGAQRRPALGLDLQICSSTFANMQSEK
jgi:hypothetical protein